MTCEGRVWKFGDDVNTDLIISGRYLDNYDESYLASHAMEGICAEFAKRVKEGDIIIAGRNFGCGSSREQAVVSLKGCGVQAVVAVSFARIFYRNAVNLGLQVYESTDAYEAFNDGDEASIDTSEGRLRASDDTREASLKGVPPHLKAIVDSGGLIPYTKFELAIR